MTTYLRVKRPRHVDPPSSLRLEGLGEEGNKRARPNTVDNLAELLHQSTYIQEIALSRSNTLPLSNTASAVYKRVEHANHKRCFSYVNALLEEEEDDGGSGEPNSKRRRLALTLVPTDSKRTTPPPVLEKKGNIILDPRSRLVQESLESVLSGQVTIAQHLDFVATDSRLADTPRAVWLAWQDVRTRANVLHAAALLNDTEGAYRVLAWKVSSLVSCQNEHGQTPFQVATAVGHAGVAQVLEQETNNAMAEKDNDYVYDVFCLDKEMNESENDEQEEPFETVELKGGIGYWSENGDLVLEAMEEMQQDDSTNEEDSNCEEHVANDYPEEEEFWDSDGEEEELNFRHRPIYMGNTAAVQVASGPTLLDKDEEYDAQYDLYEPSCDSTREYAYDPELDCESDD